MCSLSCDANIAKEAGSSLYECLRNEGLLAVPKNRNMTTCGQEM